MAGSSYASIRYRANQSDPYNRVVERNLKKLLVNKTPEEMVENLKKYGKAYGKLTAYKLAISRSSVDVRSFLKFMLASGVREFTITITDEELIKLNQYEAQKTVSDTVKK